MFCESKIIKENIIIDRTSLQINDYLTTDPQAEILIGDIIDKKFILGVLFQKQNDIDIYIRENGLELLNKYDYTIRPKLFSHNKGDLMWKGNF